MTSPGAASSNSCAWVAASQPRIVPSEDTVQYSPLQCKPSEGHAVQWYSLQPDASEPQERHTVQCHILQSNRVTGRPCHVTLHFVVLHSSAMWPDMLESKAASEHMSCYSIEGSICLSCKHSISQLTCHSCCNLHSLHSVFVGGSLWVASRALSFGCCRKRRLA